MELVNEKIKEHLLQIENLTMMKQKIHSKRLKNTIFGIGVKA